MRRSQRAWILAVACVWSVAAGAALIEIWRRREPVGVVAARPAAVADVSPRSQPSMPTRLVGVQPPVVEQRETVTPPLPERPRESVAVKLQRLRAVMLDPVAEPGMSFTLEMQRTEQLIRLATREEIEYRLAHRIGVVTLDTEDPSECGARDHDPYELYPVPLALGGASERVVLAQDEFPELYELRRDSELLRALYRHPGLYCSVGEL
jgi:hypothetical protein